MSAWLVWLLVGLAAFECASEVPPLPPPAAGGAPSVPAPAASPQADPFIRPDPSIARVAAPPDGEAEDAPPRDPVERRRAIWSSARFRCRAVSTTRFRTCSLEPREGGQFALRFPARTVRCERVIFDAGGDPARLEECRSEMGLRIPATIELVRPRGSRIWSGGHSGWSWRHNGEPYCCPGVWIEAPPKIELIDAPSAHLTESTEAFE